VVIFMNKRFGNQEGAKSKTSPQKSGFEVWTNGRLVNVWNQPRKSQDVKDTSVRVHTSNTPYIRGYSRDVKVPSPPYKGGHEGTWKGITTFKASSDFRRFFVSMSFVNCAPCFVTLMFGDPFRFSEPPTLTPTVVSAEKQLTMPPQKRTKKNVPTETDCW
jgi:hypothetical protein